MVEEVRERLVLGVVAWVEEWLEGASFLLKAPCSCRYSNLVVNQ